MYAVALMATQTSKRMTLHFLTGKRPLKMKERGWARWRCSEPRRWEQHVQQLVNTLMQRTC